MTDELADVSMFKQLAVCIQYLNKLSAEETKVHETSLAFVEISRADAATFTASLLEHLPKWSVDLTDYGMGFDRAATMS